MAKRTPQPPATLLGYRAGFVSRLIAFVLDILIIMGINITVSTVATLIARFLGFGFIFSSINTAQPQWITITKLIALSSLAIITIFVFVFYPILFWVGVGQTPGKRFMGLRVIGVDDKPLRFPQAVKRYLGYWVSALPFLLGYLWVLFDDNRQSWHDKLAHTKVIYDWDARHNATIVTALQERGAKKADKSRFVKKRLRSGNDENRHHEDHPNS